jgi:hypothetical protein
VWSRNIKNMHSIYDISILRVKVVCSTGHFTMSSLITNIYNKKTKGPTLMELFTATEKLKKSFLTTRNVLYVHIGWHGTQRYVIQVLVTHASTWVHRYSSMLQWSLPLGQRGHHARMVLSVGGSFAYFARNARCTVSIDLNSCDIPTHKSTSSPERPFSHYIHSHRLAAEMWTAMNNLLGEKEISFSFYLYRFCKYVSYGFPIINLCNPGVQYETPYILLLYFIIESEHNGYALPTNYKLRNPPLFAEPLCLSQQRAFINLLAPEFYI